MQVNLRELNWSDLWIWFEFGETPTERQKLYFEQVLDAWYSLGLLGGFNASRLTMHEMDDADLVHLNYELEDEEALPSLMHNMGEIEYEVSTARCWFDLGTADTLAIDILLNAMQTLSREYLPVDRVVIGGSGDSPPEP